MVNRITPKNKNKSLIVHIIPYFYEKYVVP